MELLLNLCWIALALPAYWLWKRERETVPRARQSSRLSSIVVLGCMLIMLFPVVSATDDLHAMRPEVEESNPSKQIAKQVDDSSSAAVSATGGLPAFLTPIAITKAEFQTMGVVADGSVVARAHTRISPDLGRAPPSV